MIIKTETKPQHEIHRGDQVLTVPEFTYRTIKKEDKTTGVHYIIQRSKNKTTWHNYYSACSWREISLQWYYTVWSVLPNPEMRSLKALGLCTCNTCVGATYHLDGCAILERKCK